MLYQLMHQGRIVVALVIELLTMLQRRIVVNRLGL